MRGPAATVLGLLLALGAGSAARAQDAGRPLILASTTSTENTGLFDAILPRFREQTGIEVRVVAVGTGQALRLGRRGDADVLLVHDRRSEEEFVRQGFGVARHPLMHNDFVLVGPASDPAAVRGEKDVAEALGRIAAARAPFVSRADDSGTHKTELRLWADAGIDPHAASGTWYRESGSGMGATLNTAAGMAAYTLADRGTWLAFRNRQDLEILVEGDPRLENSYGVILVDPRRHPHVNARGGIRLIGWLLSEAGQAAIREFRIDGEPLFFPDAVP